MIDVNYINIRIPYFTSVANFALQVIHFNILRAC